MFEKLELVQLHRVHTYLHTRDTKWRSSTLPPRWQGTSLTLAAKGWRLLGHHPITFGATTLRHCLDKCWHGRNRSKGQLDPTTAAHALACPLCAQPEDQMHSILHCPHSDAADIRRTAQDDLLREADSLLRTLSGPDLPLLTRLIQFIVTTSLQRHYPHLDRIWLGTWNADVLHDCITFSTSSDANPPSTLSYTTIAAFDRTAAKLQVILLRHFLALHKLHTQRIADLPSSPATQLDQAATGQLPAQLSTPKHGTAQRRLTDLWQVPPPYKPDTPHSHHPSRTSQLSLRHFLRARSPPLAPSRATYTPRASPILPSAASPRKQRRRRRKHHHASPQRYITEYIAPISSPRYTHTPHVAQNPANSTPDHDPDKQ